MPITGITAPLPPSELLRAEFASTGSITPALGPAPTVSRAATGYYMNAGGVWVPGAPNTPRFHHYFIDGEIVSGGILQEPEFTNLLLHSDDVSQAAWTKNGLTPSVAAGAAPNGGNATRLTDSVDGSATFHRIFQTIAIGTTGTEYIAQIFVKAETIKSVYFTTTTRLLNQVIFNLEDETYNDQSNAIKIWMRRLPSDWFWLAVKQESNASGVNATVQWWTNKNGNNYQGDGTGTLLIWNPLFGIGNSPTTPIITGGSAVTRDKDVLSWDGGNFDDIFDPVSGMVVVDVRTWADVDNIDYVRIDDTSSANELTIGKDASGDFSVVARSGDTTQMDETFNYAFNDLELVSSAVSYKRDNMIGAIKGQLLSPDTAALVPFEPSRLLLGDNLNGCVARIATYSTQSRTYSELRDLTGSYSFLFPDDLEALGATVYTDVQSLSVTRTRAKLRRIPVDAGNYYNAAPGARIRIQTTVPDVKFIFEYDAPQPASYNGAFSVLINGVEQDPVVFPSSTGEVAIQVTGTGSRLIEIIMPYGSSWLFKGLQRFGAGTIIAPAARPTKSIACFGDSITNGYFASRSTKSWPFLLAGFQNARLFNCGYGSETSAANRGTEAGNLQATITLYCIGYNDFASQIALAAFESNVQAFLTNFRAVHPTGRLYLGGPFYTPNTNTLTPANYRTRVANVVTAAGDPNTLLLDTLGASTNAVTSWPDNIHPNNFGSLEIATAFNGALGS